MSTTLFIPIAEVVTTGSGMIATGQVTTHDIEATPAAGTVTEMAGQGKVGKILSCTVAGNVLKLAAEVWDAVAMSKLWERVYRGFALTMLPDGKLLQCSLVDTPNALVLAKRGAATTLPLALDVSDVRAAISTTSSTTNTGVKKMATTTPHRGDQPNPYKHIEIGGPNSAEAEARAIELIQFAKSGAPVQVKPGHRDFFNWLQARASR
jgi:hypothetical protein